MRHATFLPDNAKYYKITEARKRQLAQFFREQQRQILAMLTAIEQQGEKIPHYSQLAVAEPQITPQLTPWQYRSDGCSNGQSDDKNSTSDGGTMGKISGRVWEKAGVNISQLTGKLSPEFRSQVPGGAANDGKFYANGLSVVIHPRSPHVPAIHMNLRYLETDQGWVGGGIDLNPMLPLAQPQQQFFHAQLRQICDGYHPKAYPAFYTHCQRYFYLPHRARQRGIGGIFFDYQPTQPEPWKLFEQLAAEFIAIYRKLTLSLYQLPWTQQQRDQQLANRSYYAEFNLLYDRGTKFGLASGGNPEAILMSMPPMVSWEHR